MKGAWLPAAVCALLATSSVSAKQAPDARGGFVQALADFSLALDGAFGDEGERIRSSLEAMARALSAWDATIQGYEAAMKAERAGAEPRLAARLHMALGGVYLDRGRVRDAIRELAAASALDPMRPDAQTLIGLARSQLAGDLPGATDALRKASQLDPGDPVRAYVLGRHLVNVGSADEALQALALFRDNYRRLTAEQGNAPPAFPFIRLGLVPESSGVEPFFPPVLYAEGFDLLADGEYDRALGAFKDAASRDPLITGTHEATLRGAAALREGAIDEAIAHLRTAIAGSPDRAGPHRVLGLVLAADERYDDAIAELRAAVRLDPDDERARLGLASALSTSGQLAEAARELRETIAVLPRSGAAHYALARVHEQQGNPGEALLELDAAVRLGPLIGLNGIYEIIGKLEAARQNFDAAAAAYGRRIDVHPNDADGHHDLGDIYLRQGRHEEALAEFSAALMLNPALAETHAAIAQVHLRDGQYSEAIEASRRAISLDPGHEQAHYTLATSLIRSGSADEGQKELEVFQRLQAGSAAARSRVFEVEGLRREAAVATADGDHQRAVALLHRVFVLQPEAASSHLDLGLAHARAGQHAEAIDRLRTAAALNPTPEIHRHLADAYAAAGQTEDSEREMATYRRLRQEALRRRSAAR